MRFGHILTILFIAMLFLFVVGWGFFSTQDVVNVYQPNLSEEHQITDLVHTIPTIDQGSKINIEKQQQMNAAASAAAQELETMQSDYAKNIDNLHQKLSNTVKQSEQRAAELEQLEKDYQQKIDQIGLSARADQQTLKKQYDEQIQQLNQQLRQAEIDKDNWRKKSEASVSEYKQQIADIQSTAQTEQQKLFDKQKEITRKLKETAANAATLQTRLTETEEKFVKEKKDLQQQYALELKKAVQSALTTYDQKLQLLTRKHREKFNQMKKTLKQTFEKNLTEQLESAVAEGKENVENTITELTDKHAQEMKETVQNKIHELTVVHEAKQLEQKHILEEEMNKTLNKKHDELFQKYKKRYEEVQRKALEDKEKIQRQANKNIELAKIVERQEGVRIGTKLEYDRIQNLIKQRKATRQMEEEYDSDDDVLSELKQSELKAEMESELGSLQIEEKIEEQFPLEMFESKNDFQEGLHLYIAREEDTDLSGLHNNLGETLVNKLKEYLALVMAHTAYSEFRTDLQLQTDHDMFRVTNIDRLIHKVFNFLNLGAFRKNFITDKQLCYLMVEYLLRNLRHFGLHLRTDLNSANLTQIRNLHVLINESQMFLLAMNSILDQPNSALQQDFDLIKSIWHEMSISFLMTPQPNDMPPNLWHSISDIPDTELTRSLFQRIKSYLLAPTAQNAETLGLSLDTDLLMRDYKRCEQIVLATFRNQNPGRYPTVHDRLPAKVRRCLMQHLLKNPHTYNIYVHNEPVIYKDLTLLDVLRKSIDQYVDYSQNEFMKLITDYTGEPNTSIYEPQLKEIISILEPEWTAFDAEFFLLMEQRAPRSFKKIRQGLKTIINNLLFGHTPHIYKDFYVHLQTFINKDKLDAFFAKFQAKFPHLTNNFKQIYLELLILSNPAKFDLSWRWGHGIIQPINTQLVIKLIAEDRRHTKTLVDLP